MKPPRPRQPADWNASALADGTEGVRQGDSHPIPSGAGKALRCPIAAGRDQAYAIVLWALPIGEVSWAFSPGSPDGARQSQIGAGDHPYDLAVDTRNTP